MPVLLGQDIYVPCPNTENALTIALSYNGDDPIIVYNVTVGAVAHTKYFIADSTSAITIRSIAIADAGSYECIVIDDNGSDRAGISLTIYGEMFHFVKHLLHIRNQFLFYWALCK